MAPDRRRVVITSTNATMLRERLERIAGVEPVERFDLMGAASADELAAGLAGAWAVVAGSEPYTPAAFARFQSLRAVLRFGVGYDAVDVGAASERDVLVCVTPGANADAVADMALMLMLACIRGLPALERDVRGGAWRPSFPSRDLTAATVAIVGLGAVGRAVARRLRAFDCTLLAVEPAPDAAFAAEHGVELVALDDALARADVVTLHAALTPASHHLIGARELALLAPHAVLVNVSRGGLIDEPALIDALAGGRLAAAGLDVFETEPLPTASPLLALPGVIVSGHVASFTDLGMERTCDAIVGQLTALLRGERPAGALNAPSWLAPAG
jgi:phosphoglycerate dehydrogenase-like enzyme